MSIAARTLICAFQIMQFVTEKIIAHLVMMNKIAKNAMARQRCVVMQKREFVWQNGIFVMVLSTVTLTQVMKR